MRNNVSQDELPDCTPEYQKLGSSTMCQYEDDENVVIIGVNDADKQEIIDLHNQLRKTVSPTAANMQTMVWAKTWLYQKLGTLL